MKQNTGTIDRLTRVLLATVVAVLYLTNLISGTLAFILGVIAVVFLLTSAIGVCVLYIPFKISTKKTAA